MSIPIHVAAGWRWASVSGIAAAFTAAVGIVLLVLFYVLQVPHLTGTGQGWGTDPGASLGDANDVSGVVFEVLLLPLILLLWRVAGDPNSWRDRVIVGLGVASTSAAALAASGMIIHLLDEGIASAVSGAGSVLIGVWIGLVSWRAAGARTMPQGLTRLGKTLAVALLGSALLVAISFAAPRSSTALIFTVVVAIPGVIAYLAMPIWIGWAAIECGRRTRGSTSGPGEDGFTRRDSQAVAQGAASGRQVDAL